MKNVTVREVAEALGLTKRAIMYRLEDGRLKGVRVKNENGQSEWRIYPTKEITEALNKLAEANPTTEPAKAILEEVVDADFDLSEEENEGEVASPRSWTEVQRAQVKAMAEEFMQPLMERLDAQSRALASKDRQIAELQIKLLPDLEKKAEDERKLAEAKELEIIALQKVLEAKASVEKENEVLKGHVEVIESRSEQVRREKEVEVASLAADLAAKEQALKEAEAVSEKVVELESKLPDLESKLAQEIADKARLEEEKAALQAALDAKSKSWFQKLFSSPQ